MYIYLYYIFFFYTRASTVYVLNEGISHVYYICNATVIEKTYNYISNFTITTMLTEKNYQLNIAICTIISQNVFYSLRLCNVDCWVYNILVFNIYILHVYNTKKCFYLSDSLNLLKCITKPFIEFRGNLVQR